MSCSGWTVGSHRIFSCLAVADAVFVGVSVYLQRRQGYQPARGSSQISALQGLSKRVDEELWSATNGHGSQPELEISTLTNHRL